LNNYRIISDSTFRGGHKGFPELPLYPQRFRPDKRCLSAQFYRLALWQGYGRYLQLVSTSSIADIQDVEHFKTCFFPDGFDTDQAKLTVRG